VVAAILRVLFHAGPERETPAANALFKRLIEHGTHAESGSWDPVRGEGGR
jgi:hypothetical protein